MSSMDGIDVLERLEEMLKFNGITRTDIKTIEHQLGSIIIELQDGESYSLMLIKTEHDWTKE